MMTTRLPRQGEAEAQVWGWGYNLRLSGLGEAAGRSLTTATASDVSIWLVDRVVK